MKPFAWGVLSTAKIATTKVIPALQRSTIATVAAIASRSAAQAEATAAGLGIAKAYGSYEALLADPEIDGIYNPLPNDLHLPWTLKAIEAGKHVLCEKPLTLDAGQVPALIAARDRRRVQVAEAFMIRCHPQWLRARELVRSGRIGEVQAIHVFFSYYNDDPANIRNRPETGGGGLMDIGCYAVVGARFLFEADPIRAAALIQRDPAFGTDRLASGLLEFPGSRHLAFSCATQLVPYQRVQVCGTRGRIEIQIPFNALPDRPMTILIDDGSDLGGAGIVRESFDAVDQYTLQGDAFVRAARGEAPLGWPLEDALVNMRILDALAAAGTEGRWVAL